MQLVWKVDIDNCKTPPPSQMTWYNPTRAVCNNGICSCAPRQDPSANETAKIVQLLTPRCDSDSRSRLRGKFVYWWYHYSSLKISWSVAKTTTICRSSNYDGWSLQALVSPLRGPASSPPPAVLVREGMGSLEASAKETTKTAIATTAKYLARRIPAGFVFIAFC
jgi:hypothetical protein